MKIPPFSVVCTGIVVTYYIEVVLTHYLQYYHQYIILGQVDHLEQAQVSRVNSSKQRDWIWYECSQEHYYTDRFSEDTFQRYCGIKISEVEVTVEFKVM